MNPYRVIVHINIRSDDLSTLPDGPNTLTRQSASTNNVPRDPLLGPVTSILSVYKPYIEAKKLG